VGAAEHGEFSNAYGEAFRWTPEGGMQGLGYLKAGSNYSRAFAVSRDGSTIAGISQWGFDAERTGFTWTEQGGMMPLPHLPGANPYADARAINADGSVVVGFASSPGPQGYSHAVRWTDGEVEDLGSITGFVRSSLLAVNDAGDVAGGSVDGAPPTSAAVWTPSTGLVLLTEYLAANGVDVPERLHLVEVAAISGDGLTFGGTFQDLDTKLYGGFVTIIPGPAPALVLLTPCLLAQRRRG
jgi:probable HAF family extracellular repeat protein